MTSPKGILVAFVGDGTSVVQISPAAKNCRTNLYFDLKVYSQMMKLTVLKEVLRKKQNFTPTTFRFAVYLAHILAKTRFGQAWTKFKDILSDWFAQCPVVCPDRETGEPTNCQDL